MVAIVVVFPYVSDAFLLSTVTPLDVSIVSHSGEAFSPFATRTLPEAPYVVGAYNVVVPLLLPLIVNLSCLLDVISSTCVLL